MVEQSKLREIFVIGFEFYNYFMIEKWIIGIDEVGRGPLAGPVTVCALAVPVYFHQNITGQFDSKKLSQTKREDIARILCQMRHEGLIDYRIASVSARVIDNRGIVYAVNRAIRCVLSSSTAKLLGVRDPKWELTEILLDGGLRAPKEYVNQRTIIRGDSTEPIIGLASILAKVHRDRFMTHLDSRYPSWGFEKHKGYGTADHYKALRRHGPSPHHRLTYLRNMLT